MMLVGNGWAFIHIPKCGGTSVRGVLKGREIKEVLPMYPEHTVDHRYHWIAKNQPPGRVFCFVRHPLDWLKSYWTMRMKEQPNKNKVLDQYLIGDFEVFVRRVCRFQPGYVGRMFDAYTEYATEIYKLEQGIDKVLSSILERRVTSFVKNKGNTPSHTKRTQIMVARSESYAIEKYGY